jgi:hypothetical protein
MVSLAPERGCDLAAGIASYASSGSAIKKLRAEKMHYLVHVVVVAFALKSDLSNALPLRDHS